MMHIYVPTHNFETQNPVFLVHLKLFQFLKLSFRVGGIQSSWGAFPKLRGCLVGPSAPVLPPPHHGTIALISLRVRQTSLTPALPHPPCPKAHPLLVPHPSPLALPAQGHLPAASSGHLVQPAPAVLSRLLPRLPMADEHRITDTPVPFPQPQGALFLLENPSRTEPHLPTVVTPQLRHRFPSHFPTSSDASWGRLPLLSWSPGRWASGAAHLRQHLRH